VTRDATGPVTVVNNYLNISTQKARGWEFNLRYSRAIGPGRFTFDALVTKYIEQSSRLFEGEALIDANGTVGVPAWTGSFNATYALNRVKLRYGLEWTGGTGNRTYEYLATDSETGTFDPDDVEYLRTYYQFRTPDYFLHSASVEIDVNDAFEFTFGVRNLFDRKPPRITSDGTYYNTIGNAPLYSGYDYYGRTFYVNVTTSF
jgi:outer membrane receptor protein involved in Fe transport